MSATNEIANYNFCKVIRYRSTNNGSGHHNDKEDEKFHSELCELLGFEERGCVIKWIPTLLFIIDFEGHVTRVRQNFSLTRLALARNFRRISASAQEPWQ